MLDIFFFKRESFFVRHLKQKMETILKQKKLDLYKNKKCFFFLKQKNTSYFCKGQAFFVKVSLSNLILSKLLLEIC